MITNGNDYINLPNKHHQERYIAVSRLDEATKFKLNEANEFIKSILGGESKWGIRKVATGCAKKYVITTGVNYVANSSKYAITPDFSGAKWFRSAADADTYIRTHDNLFDNPVIVDDDGCLADVGERNTFTDEQLEVLGIKEEMHRARRICIPKSTRDVVYENGHGVCAICGRPVDKKNFTIDHIVPLARGGKNEVSNYQIACSDCNRLKGSRMNDEFINGLATILSAQITDNDVSEESSNMLIRAIVRNKISGIVSYAQ